MIFSFTLTLHLKLVYRKFSSMNINSSVSPWSLTWYLFSLFCPHGYMTSKLTVHLHLHLHICVIADVASSIWCLLSLIDKIELFSTAPNLLLAQTVYYLVNLRILKQSQICQCLKVPWNLHRLPLLPMIVLKILHLRTFLV
jgi:hypothetical protein